MTRSSSSARSIASGLMIGVTKLYFSKSKTCTLSPSSRNRSENGHGVYIAQLAMSGFQSSAIRYVSSSVSRVSFSRPTMNCASATMPFLRSSSIARLFCAIVVSLLKRSSFSCAAASVPSETWISPARRYIGSSSSSRRMSVTRVLMPHSTGSLRRSSSSQNWTNFFLWIVGSSSARMKKPTPCSRTRVSISSTTFTGSRTR